MLMSLNYIIVKFSLMCCYFDIFIMLYKNLLKKFAGIGCQLFNFCDYTNIVLEKSTMLLWGSILVSPSSSYRTASVY